MAKLNTRKEDRSSETPTTSMFGAEGQSRNYDPALASLFAQSVSNVQRQSTCSQSIDIVLVGPSENCRQTSPSIRESFYGDERCRSQQVPQ